MKTLVLGLGNPLVSDDSVGLRVAAELKSRLADRPEINVDEDYWGGLRLMERLVGYQRAVDHRRHPHGGAAGDDPLPPPGRPAHAAERLGPRRQPPHGAGLGAAGRASIAGRRQHPPRRRRGGGCRELRRVVHPGGGGGGSPGGRCGGRGPGPFSPPARGNGIISVAAVGLRSWKISLLGWGTHGRDSPIFVRRELGQSPGCPSPGVTLHLCTNWPSSRR